MSLNGTPPQDQQRKAQRIEARESSGCKCQT